MSTSAREVFEGFLQAVSTGDRDRMADFFAPDVVIEMPFAPAEMARSEGRENLRARMKAAQDFFTIEGVENVQIHETTDPEVIVAEYGVIARAGGGDPFTLHYITITRIRDGLIVSSRDYGNPKEAEAAFGDRTELNKAVVDASGGDVAAV
jgi:ketosteroid isomerase-like protein